MVSAASIRSAGGSGGPHRAAFSRSPAVAPPLCGGFRAEGPLAAAVSHPVNRRGSCWTLHWPQQLRASAQVSCRSVQRVLLQAAVQRGEHQVRSWVMRCPAADADAIALLRELGFQPLRPFQVWWPWRHSPSRQQLYRRGWPGSRSTVGMPSGFGRSSRAASVTCVRSPIAIGLICSTAGAGCGVLLAGEMGAGGLCSSTTGARLASLS